MHPGDQTRLWQEAVAFAARAHRHQLRRDGRTPYVSHVMRVALTVSHVFRCDDQVALCLAILHDTIEDTTTDYDDLLERFGRDVAEGVAALTKNMALPEERREAEYDARLSSADWRVKLVKLADTYDNFCDVGTWPSDDQPAKRAKALDKCDRAIVVAGGDSPGHETLRHAIAATRALIAPYRSLA